MMESSMDVYARYTPFPDLDYGNEDVPNVTFIDLDFQISHLPVHEIVLSWAFFLGSFTGDQSPIFCLDGKPVRADLQTQTSENVQLDSSVKENGVSTGIFTSDVCIVDIRSTKRQS